MHRSGAAFHAGSGFNETLTLRSALGRAKDKPMSESRWNDVDSYVAGMFVPGDAMFENALATSDAAGLPAIQVSPVQGRWLELLARSLRATRVLEVGTLGGYSTLWLARGVGEQGRVVTLELDATHARVARANFAHAGFAERIELREGPARESLAALAGERGTPFDLIFVDADKPSLPEYFTQCLALSRPGTVIVVDNVVREGEVTRADSADPSVRGVRRMNELIAREPRVSATVIQTVGSKKWDGFAYLLVER